MEQGQYRFKENEFFSYGWKQKFRTNVRILSVLIGLVLFALLVVLSSFISGLSLLPAYLTDFFSSLAKSIATGEPVGIFIMAFSGGLFFIFLPLEIIFLNYLRTGSDPWLTFALYLSGLLCAHTLDYWIGYRLSRLVKLMVHPRKFYGMKGILNRYGKVTIFVINTLPLPSPALSATLGAFRYRPSLFFALMLAGQVTLYSILTIFYVYFFQYLPWGGKP